MDKIDIPFEILRSKRRSIGLEVLSDTRLLVRANHRTPINQIHDVITNNIKWIYKKQNFQKERSIYQVIHTTYEEGDEFFYQGVKYPLNKFILDPAKTRSIKRSLIKWYKGKAYHHIKERVSAFQDIMGVQHNSIKITSAKTRWGSCSRGGRLNFTYRLIMLPQGAIDYIIVHELAHLKVMNHSARFWKIVLEFMPDYKERRRWIRKNSYLFEL
ncbi:MAG: SprT family zinc-dependent metalloprotease [bacterium]